MVYTGFLLKIPQISDFTPFLAISHLFPHLFNFFFHHIIRLLICYRNIYGLHRFSIENSSKLAISHLFWRYNTFFSHLFQIFFSSYNPTTYLLQEYIWFTQVFYWKFLQISDFTPFFINFTPYFTPF